MRVLSIHYFLLFIQSNLIKKNSVLFILGCLFSFPCPIFFFIRVPFISNDGMDCRRLYCTGEKMSIISWSRTVCLRLQYYMDTLKPNRHHRFWHVHFTAFHYECIIYPLKHPAITVSPSLPLQSEIRNSWVSGGISGKSLSCFCSFLWILSQRHVMDVSWYIDLITFSLVQDIFSSDAISVTSASTPSNLYCYSSRRKKMSTSELQVQRHSVSLTFQGRHTLTMFDTCC